MVPQESSQTHHRCVGKHGYTHSILKVLGNEDNHVKKQEMRAFNAELFDMAASGICASCEGNYGCRHINKINDNNWDCKIFYRNSNFSPIKQQEGSCLHLSHGYLKPPPMERPFPCLRNVVMHRCLSLSRESSSNCFQHCSANIPTCWWHKETPTVAQGSSDVTRHGTVFSPLFFPFS